MFIPLRTRIARRFSSLLPKTGLIPVPKRPQGISAILRVWNEEDCIEESIESIKDQVDEIVAVDTGSTDGTPGILARLAPKIKNMKVLKFVSNIPWEFSNFTIDNTSFRWILKWDSDFVSIPGEDKGVGRLRKMVFGLDPDLYYYINPTLIELSGDFRHQFPGMRFRTDIEIFTYSDNVRYVPVRRRFVPNPAQFILPPKYLPEASDVEFEGMKLPLHYRILAFKEIAGFHVNIKPDVRHLLGYLHLQWLACGDPARFPTLNSYAEDYVRTKWGFPDLPSAAAFFMTEFARALAPYDRSLGELPENIKVLAGRSPYEVQYKDGKITGRATVRRPA